MRRRISSEDGFTLVELLMAMAITAIITGVVGSALIVGLRTTDATAERLNESHDAQLLSMYLIRDLQSVSASGVDIAAGSMSGCAPAGNEGAYTGWRNALALSWTEDVGSGPVAYRAEYRLGQLAADSRWQLVRYSCGGGGGTMTLVVAHQLAAPAGATAAPGVVVDTTQLPVVKMTLREPSGFAFTVSGQRRTPNATPLPAPVWACTVLSAISKPDPATRATALPGPLTADLRIEVQTGGSCSAVKVTVTPNDATTRTVSLSESPVGSGFWTTIISATADVWTDGDKSWPITNGSGTIATLNLTVKQACIASLFTATPSSARRVQAASPSVLSTDIALAVQTTGVCQPLTVEYEPRTGVTASVALTDNGGGSWSGTILGSAQTWVDGAVAVKLREPIGPDLATRTLVVTPSCQVLTAVAAPNPVSRGIGQAKNQLTSDVIVTVTTDGACDALDVQFQPGTGGTAATVPMIPGVPGTWTATLSATAYDWTNGSKPLTVRDGFGAALQTFNLVVN